MEVLDHLELGLQAEIRNAIMGINTPAELAFARQYGYNDTSKRININDGTAVRYLLQDNDISIDADFTIDSDKFATREAIKLYIDSRVGGVGTFRGDHNPTTGVPTSPDIKAGDYWRITTEGTITGLTPVEALQAGDLLFARIDEATAATDFFAVQGNFATAADIALLSTGTYGGTATNVQGALEELFVLSDITLNGSLEWRTWISPRELGVKLTSTDAGLALFGDGLGIDLPSFVTGAAATGTEILASIGTGANAGKIVLDSDAISAAVGDFLPLIGNDATTAMTGDIFVDTTQSGGFRIVDSGNSGNGIFMFDTAPIRITQNGSNWGLGNGFSQIDVSWGQIISRSRNNDANRWLNVDHSPESWAITTHEGVGITFSGMVGVGGVGLRYSTDLSATWDTLAVGVIDRIIPDIGYVKQLIAGGIDFAELAGDGIAYTADKFLIDLDTNSGLELNGTSPDGKLRIKGLANYSATTAPNQIPLGYNATGNLIADKSLFEVTASNGLTKVGNDIQLGGALTGSVSITGTTHDFGYSVRNFELISGDQISFTATTGVEIVSANAGITLSGQLIASVDIIELQAATFLFESGSGKGIEYGADYSATYTLRSLVDKEYVDTVADFAAKAGQGINYTGSIYNIDLDTNSGLELNGTSPDGKLRIKGLADFSAVLAGDQVALGYNATGNLIANKADIVGAYLPLTGTAGTDLLSGTVNVQSALKFEMSDTTNKAKFEFLNSNGFSANSNSADDSQRAWLQLNGSAGTAALFTDHTATNNASISLSQFGAEIAAMNGANVARATMSLARKGFFYESDYSSTWNGLTEAERNRMIPDIAYVGAAITAAGRESHDIVGTGSTKTFTVTHAKGAFPIVQLWRVDTNQLVSATITNISATQVGINFSANVPNGRTHKVVIM